MVSWDEKRNYIAENSRQLICIRKSLSTKVAILRKINPQRLNFAWRVRWNNWRMIQIEFHYYLSCFCYYSNLEGKEEKKMPGFPCLHLLFYSNFMKTLSKWNLKLITLLLLRKVKVIYLFIRFNFEPNGSEGINLIKKVLKEVATLATINGLTQIDSLTIEPWVVVINSRTYSHFNWCVDWIIRKTKTNKNKI